MEDLQHSGSVPAFLAEVHLAHRQVAKQLTLWPLVRSDEGRSTRELAYVPLCDALARGDVRVEEVGGGRVPHVAVVNHGKLPVLVLFGEEIIGAMQNRIANASFLVGPGKRVKIDVSCAEAGRWSSVPGAAFAASDHVVSASLRRGMAAQVTASRARTGSYAADQGSVWEGVQERLTRAGVASPSAAYSEFASSRSSEHGAISRSFPCVRGQVGFVAMIGDSVVGAEAVGAPEVYERVHDRLLRSYTIDAMDRAALRSPSAAGSYRFDSPESFLSALKGAKGSEAPSLGLGKDVRLEGRAIQGCALSLKEEFVCLTAFSVAERDRSGPARGTRASGAPDTGGRGPLEWMRSRLRRGR